MKITAHPITGQLILTSENPDDLYKIGKLSMILKGSHVHKLGDGTRELNTDLGRVLETLLGN